MEPVPIPSDKFNKLRRQDETALKIGIKAFVYKPMDKADLAKTKEKTLQTP